ncbi:MAG: CPBP family intramembrane metalloprotease [Cellulosilyticum sp.]|nr:CPBP family intramembrane metalloprotease [Cellulosilyticum sp.]
MSKKKSLIVYGLSLVPIMLVVMYTLTRVLGKTEGYIIGYGIYLILLLMGIIKFNGGERHISKSKKKGNWIYYSLSFVPVGATFVVAFLPQIQSYTSKMLWIVIVYAILNGTLEELFWRYTYNNIFGQEMSLSYIWPTINFTCWHFALLLADGMTYTGGAIALVGGAGVMGIIWGWMMYKTHNIKIAILAHICVNLFAFSQLVYENWFI